MKKKISGIILFLLLAFILPIKALASDYSMRWENTYVNVLYNTPISNYIEIPKATLYHLGVKVENQNISYLRTGIGTENLLQNVDTSVVKDYKVTYLAYDYDNGSGACDGYKQEITFHVYETESPTIHIYKKIVTIPMEAKSYDFKTDFYVTDNYKAEEVNVGIDDSAVIYGKIGTYQVLIKAVDASGNVSTDTISLVISDTEAPTISIINYNYSHDIGSKFDPTYVFEAYDNLDGDISKSIQLIDFNPTRLGNYLVSVCCMDSSGNMAYSKAYIDVVDISNPTLILSQNTLELEYGDFLYEEDFYDFITSVSDNYDVLEKSDVIVDFSLVNFDAIGFYDVTYSVTDSSLNTAEEILYVRIKTSNPPVVICTNANLQINEIFDINKYIEVIDPTCPDILDTLQIEKNTVDTSKAGSYYVTFNVHNNSGLYQQAILYVNVLDDTKVEDNNYLYYGIALAAVCAGVVIFIIVRKKKKMNKLE